MMNGWLRNHGRPGPCLPLLVCFKASSAWQLTKAQSQNIINYKLNLTWAEIKHAHQLFKLRSFVSSLRCLAGLGPAPCVPEAGGSQCAPRGSFRIPIKQGPPAGSISTLPANPEAFPASQEGAASRRWWAHQIEHLPPVPAPLWETPNHCNTERNGHHVFWKTCQKARSHLSWNSLLCIQGILIFAKITSEFSSTAKKIQLEILGQLISFANWQYLL